MPKVHLVPPGEVLAAAKSLSVWRRLTEGHMADSGGNVEALQEHNIWVGMCRLPQIPEINAEFFWCCCVFQFCQPQIGKGIGVQTRQHARSRLHQDALLHFCGEAEFADVYRLAPAAAEFSEAMEKLRKGRSARDGGGCSDKKNLIRWSLSEAVLDRSREAVRRSESLVILRDERHGKLMLRIRACGPDMTVHSAVLGMETMPRGKATDILEATRSAMRTFSTSRCNPPRNYRGPRPDCDETLFDRLTEKCEMVVTDSASSELLAQDLGRGRRGQAGGRTPVLFPNQKITGRDRAHASQRLISRPWESDTLLKALMQSVVQGPDSFCQKVWHSRVYSSWFAAGVENSSFPAGKTLSAAQHRFCSFSKPLGRFVLHLDVAFDVLNKIVAIKGSQDARWAVKFLRGLTPEKLLTVAMCADMADTCLQLTRFLDDEGLDIARLNEEVSVFCSRIQVLTFPDRQVLFCDQQCFTLHGFTKRCLSLLESGSLVQFVDGSARLVGQHGLQPAKAAAVRRMQACVTVCLEAVRAEFPSFEAIMAFKAFNVEDSGASTKRRADGMNSEAVRARQDSLKRLSQLFKVDSLGLQREFEMLRGMALA
ncbi:Uncharacterized protein SCF082_LOCUS43483 [Durusdinium trenchii]|uniref:Uncharacterized protein n=1 Tax=Durusdinium trenchii TaxID=1381693 RepID=A0ABP0QX14_9DINO